MFAKRLERRSNKRELVLALDMVSCTPARRVLAKSVTSVTSVTSVVSYTLPGADGARWHHSRRQHPRTQLTLRARAINLAWLVCFYLFLFILFAFKVGL